MKQNLDRRCKPVYCTDNGRRWSSAVKCAEELGVPVSNVYFVCNGKQKTCAGFHLSYEENYTELKNRMADRIVEMNEKLLDLEHKAALWDAFQAEQEKKRKAEEERNAEIAKLERKLECQKQIFKEIDVKHKIAMRRIVETEKKLAELKGDDDK